MRQSKAWSSSPHGHAAGGLHPRPRGRGSTQDAHCWSGLHSPAARPAAPVRGQGTSTLGTQGAWWRRPCRPGVWDPGLMDVRGLSLKALRDRQETMDGQELRIRTASQRPQGGSAHPEKGSRLQHRSGVALEEPCHQALTGSCAKPRGSPWQAQASWLPCSSDPQNKGRSLGTIRLPGGRGPGCTPHTLASQWPQGCPSPSQRPELAPHIRYWPVRGVASLL